MQLSYAIGTFKQGHDQFVVREDHEKALKAIRAAGFERIELPAGTGRWEPLGNREWIEKFYGSLAGFRGLLEETGIAGITSYSFDPGLQIFEEGTRGRSILDAADHAGIAGTVGRLAGLTRELGGDIVAVRAAPSWWRTGDLGEAQIAVLAAGWSVAGRAAAGEGARIALNLDCIGAIRTEAQIAAVLEATDAGAVGLSIDTADCVIMGLDPAALLRRFADRVWHVQLKDALAADSAGEAREKYAERTLLNEGGARGVPRWYGEVLSPGGLVDFPGFVAALHEVGYRGPVVVESDQSPHPVSSVLMNGWAMQRLFPRNT